MIYQISNDNALISKKALNPEFYVKHKPTNKR